MGGEDVGVERLELADLLAADLVVEVGVADALDVGGAEVERQVVRVLVGGAAREPDAVGVGNDGHAVLVFNGALIVGHAAADRPPAVELVIGTDGEEPRVVPIVLDDGAAELGAGKVEVLDVKRVEVGPLGPAGRTGETKRVASHVAENVIVSGVLMRTSMSLRMFVKTRPLSVLTGTLLRVV